MIQKSIESNLFAQVTSYKLQVTSYKLQVTRYKLQVTIQPVCTFDEYRYARVALSPRIRCQHLKFKKKFEMFSLCVSLKLTTIVES